MAPGQIHQMQIEKYRNMSGEERLLIGLRLHELACNISRDAIRALHPNATPEQVEEKLKERLLLTYVNDLKLERRS